MSIEIIKGKPMPPPLARSVGSSQIADKMQVGDCVKQSYKVYPHRKAKASPAVAEALYRKYGKGAARIRTVVEDGEKVTYVWRVK
jgi:hypothetical protein